MLRCSQEKHATCDTPGANEASTHLKNNEVSISLSDIHKKNVNLMKDGNLMCTILDNKIRNIEENSFIASCMYLQFVFLVRVQ